MIREDRWRAAQLKQEPAVRISKRHRAPGAPRGRAGAVTRSDVLPAWCIFWSSFRSARSLSPSSRPARSMTGLFLQTDVWDHDPIRDSQSTCVLMQGAQSVEGPSKQSSGKTVPEFYPQRKDPLHAAPKPAHPRVPVGRPQPQLFKYIKGDCSDLVVIWQMEHVLTMGMLQLSRGKSPQSRFSETCFRCQPCQRPSTTSPVQLLPRLRRAPGGG